MAKGLSGSRNECMRELSLWVCYTLLFMFESISPHKGSRIQPSKKVRSLPPWSLKALSCHCLNSPWMDTSEYSVLCLNITFYSCFRYSLYPRHLHQAGSSGKLHLFLEGEQQTRDKAWGHHNWVGCDWASDCQPLCLQAWDRALHMPWWWATATGRRRKGICSNMAHG